MTASPLSVRPWERSRHRRRERAQRRKAAESIGFLIAAIVALGLAALLAAVTR